MLILRYATTQIAGPIGPFIDKTDGVSLETALTMTNEKISFVMGSAVVLNNITGVNSADNALNYISASAALMGLALTVANTSYLGHGLISINDASNHCPVWEPVIILPQTVYDHIFGSGLVDSIADAVLNEILSEHTAAGTVGAALSAAGNSGDPWSTVLPGTYASGTAGKIIGDSLDAKVSTRSTMGDGSIEWNYTVTDYETGLPIADVLVTVCLDVAGSVKIAETLTNMYGIAKFRLDPIDTIYVFRRKVGYTFNNPDVESVEAEEV
jgi:hypothetical protein